MPRTSEPIRILIVDDSAFVRRAVERMLAADPGLEVAGAATNGTEAVELAASLRPDVIVMDVNMPELDGIQALREIMTRSPAPVIMMSTHTRQGADTTLRALELGAVDFVDKTSAGTVMDIHGLAPVLLEKIRAVAGAGAPRGSVPEAPAAPPEKFPPAGVAGDCPYDLVVIGASTGGPRALVELLSTIPREFGAGVVIAQHMPPGFTTSLAERLDRTSSLHVTEASDGDPVLAGHALIAPGGRQIALARHDGRLVVRIDDGEADAIHRPSVNRLFHSAADQVGGRTVGVILTGMGDDGAAGLRAIREAGGRTLVESEETAVIYGMPRAAAEAAERVLPLPQLGPALGVLCAPGTAAEEGAR